MPVINTAVSSLNMEGIDPSALTFGSKSNHYISLALVHLINIIRHSFIWIAMEEPTLQQVKWVGGVGEEGLIIKKSFLFLTGKQA